MLRIYALLCGARSFGRGHRRRRQTDARSPDAGGRGDAGLARSYAETIQQEQLAPAEKYEAFFAVLKRDAENAVAAVDLVLAQPTIGSQLVDNLNASIHLRALLADLFLVTEILAVRQRARLRRRMEPVERAERRFGVVPNLEFSSAFPQALKLSMWFDSARVNSCPDTRILPAFFFTGKLPCNAMSCAIMDTCIRRKFSIILSTRAMRGRLPMRMRRCGSRIRPAATFWN